MFTRMLFLFLVIAAAVNATPITWGLSDVRFDDGGLAVGFFVYDASTHTVSNYSILTSGGNETIFPALLYTPGGPYDAGVSLFADAIIFDSTFTNGHAYGLGFRLAPVTGLTNAGGTVDIDLTNPWVGQCYDCSPSRILVSGQLVSGVGAAPNIPEPSTVALTLIPVAIGAIWARRRRNQAIR